MNNSYQYKNTTNEINIIGDQVIVKNEEHDILVNNPEIKIKTITTEFKYIINKEEKQNINNLINNNFKTPEGLIIYDPINLETNLKIIKDIKIDNPILQIENNLCCKYEDMTLDFFEKSGGISIKNIPLILLTKNIIKKALEKNSNDIQYIPEYYLTQEIVNDVLENDIDMIKYIPKKFITKKIAWNILNFYIDKIEYIPKEFITFTDAKKLLQEQLLYIIYIPEELRTIELINYKMAKQFIKLDINNLIYLPIEYRAKLLFEATQTTKIFDIQEELLIKYFDKKNYDEFFDLILENKIDISICPDQFKLLLSERVCNYEQYILEKINKNFNNLIGYYFTLEQFNKIFDLELIFFSDKIIKNNFEKENIFITEERYSSYLKQLKYKYSVCILGEVGIWKNKLYASKIKILNLLN
jgi:hypothetical protein